MHPEAPGLITSRRHDTTFGIVSHRYRFTPQFRIVALFYSCEELIHVHMDDLRHVN
jgi:hypothetical protein